MPLTEEERYMKEAIRQAHKAWKLGEVPIGCVIVRDGKIIARGYNRRNTDKNTLAHAELQAIRKASRAAGDWRLEDCTIYVTLETLPDVRRGHRTGQDPPAGDRQPESQSRLRGFGAESSAGAGIQPSGRNYGGRVGRRVLSHADELFPGSAGEEERSAKSYGG